MTLKHVQQLESWVIQSIMPPLDTEVLNNNLQHTGRQQALSSRVREYQTAINCRSRCNLEEWRHHRPDNSVSRRSQAGTGGMGSSRTGQMFACVYASVQEQTVLEGRNWWIGITIKIGFSECQCDCDSANRCRGVGTIKGVTYMDVGGTLWAGREWIRIRCGPH